MGVHKAKVLSRVIGIEINNTDMLELFFSTFLDRKF